MAKIFITGSADGLGQMAARSLIDQGQHVVLHARNGDRARDALHALPQADTVLIADLANMEQTKKLATQVNELGRFDTIIHNAGVYQASQTITFAVNTLAPYILTCLIERPRRLIYLSSGMHLQGNPVTTHLTAETGCGYSDSKLHAVMLTKAVARIWPDVYANAVNPGWVPTRMGGAGAPDNLQKGVETQVWLAVSEDEQAKVSGKYFHHKREARFMSAADDSKLQNELLHSCERITGVIFPFTRA